MSLSMLLFGYRRISAKAPNAADLLNLCMEEGIDYSDFCGEADGSVSFSCFLPSAKRLLKAAEARGVPISTVRVGGLPVQLWRRRSRAGLLLGGLCAIILFVLSGLFVWDVRVMGNETLSASEVRRELEACGFGVGSYLPRVDTDVLENRVLLSSDRIAWISVYMEGTVARVQVVEQVARPAEEAKRPANLVAKRDGQIEYVRLYRGSCEVKVGQAVRTGDLLVSGVYDSQTVGCRFTRAAGNVMARTEHTLRVEIPLSYVEKRYTHTQKGAIWLNFFQKNVKIFKSTGKEDGECDIIESVKSFSGFGQYEIPVSLTVEQRRYYEEVAVTRTEQEALELAYAELACAIEALGDVQLLRKEITTSFSEEALILECTVVCIEDIAEQVEFDVSEPFLRAVP